MSHHKIQFLDLSFRFSEWYPKKQIQSIINKIDLLLKTKDFIIIAIDGKSGSGKTTLANALEKYYDCNIFHMDNFFLRPELKTKERLKEVGGNVDYIRFKEEVMDGILSFSKFQYQIYDCQSMSLTEYIQVTPKKLNIIEGSYSMHPTLIDYYHLKIFLDIDDTTQKQRILKRNGPLLYKRFIEEWIPKENEYFEKMKIKEKSDIILKSF
ncbi:uridine kinase [Garciella nitratireducens]|uniref:Uridine kinase n=1 Tax=Garciella nitratireducens DSM 15102 TaxID=1121911 RepID=A0A1T4M7G3_9FIRM|nr:uridine kinase [Garciella nitratireducens]SJZ62841.1 Uridine kinase [Garciella nitratireducens DSM 15102]